MINFLFEFNGQPTKPADTADLKADYLFSWEPEFRSKMEHLDCPICGSQRNATLVLWGTPHQLGVRQKDCCHPEFWDVLKAAVPSGFQSR